MAKDKDDVEAVLADLQEVQKKSKGLVPILTAVTLSSGESKQYNMFPDDKCKFCNSPHREDAERLYLDTRVTLKVLNYLNQKHEEEGNPVKWFWYNVDNHLKNHCDFSPQSINYLKKIQDISEEYSEIERQPISYGIRMCLDMITEMKSFDNSKNTERMIELNKTTNAILNTMRQFTALEYEISGLRTEAEKVITDMAAKFSEVMSKLLDTIQGADNKEAIKTSIRDFQEFLKDRLSKMK